MTITPEDRDLPMSARWRLGLLEGDELPKPITGKGKTMSGEVGRLGWKILPVPYLNIDPATVRDPNTGGATNMRFISYWNVREWLIVPPEDSPIRARTVSGKVRAIRVAYRLAMFGEDAAQACGEG